MRLKTFLLFFFFFYFPAEIIIYTRTTEPSVSVLNLMYTTIAMNNLPVYDLQLTNQERCKYPNMTQIAPVSVEAAAPPSVVS